MYIQDLGGRPIGEIFCTPPNDDNTFHMVLQYYDGRSVPLVGFRSTKQSQDYDSNMGRIYRLEDRQQILLENEAKSGKMDEMLNQLVDYLKAKFEYDEKVYTDLGVSENKRKDFGKLDAKDKLETLASSVASYDSGGDIEWAKNDVKDIIEKRDSLNPTEAKYMVVNGEELSDKRGW